MQKRPANEKNLVRLVDLLKLPTTEVAELARNGWIIEYQTGERVCRAGDVSPGLVVLLEGELQVERPTQDGRDLVIDTITYGRSCSVSCASMLTSKPSIANVYAKTDCDVWYLPSNPFNEAMSRSLDFRHYIYDCVENGFANVADRLEQVAFGSLKARTARLLLSLADDDSQIAASHEELAAHLASAREVVSRTLRDFSKQGIIQTSRRSIRIVNQNGLHEIADA